MMAWLLATTQFIQHPLHVVIEAKKYIQYRNDHRDNFPKYAFWDDHVTSFTENDTNMCIWGRLELT